MNILGRIWGVLCQAIGLAPMAAAQSNSTNGFDLNEVWYVVIGAVIGFVASIGMVIVERMLDRRGKLKIYYQIFGGERAKPSFEISFLSEGDMCFVIPMQIEIQNTSRTSRVIRDLNAVLYKSGQPVACMTQLTKISSKVPERDGTIKTESHDYGAEKGAYSFVIESLSIRHEHCSFFYSYAMNCNIFDEVRIRYYDEKDKEHTYSILRVDNCLEERTFEGTPDWVLLK